MSFASFSPSTKICVFLFFCFTTTSLLFYFIFFFCLFLRKKVFYYLWILCRKDIQMDVIAWSSYIGLWFRFKWVGDFFGVLIERSFKSIFFKWKGKTLQFVWKFVTLVNRHTEMISHRLSTHTATRIYYYKNTEAS